MDLTILGISGAYTKQGQVAHLLDETLEACQQWAEGETTPVNITTEIIHLSEVMTEFNAPEENIIPANLRGTVDKLLRADIIIFASPVYWFNVSPLLMQFFVDITALEYDWDFPLCGKIGAAITHCDEDGGEKVAGDILAPLRHFGLITPPLGGFWRNRVGARFSEDHWQVDGHQKLLAQYLVRLAVELKLGRIRSGHA